MSNQQRVLLVVGALVVLVVGLILASPGGNDAKKTATAPAATTDATTTTTQPAATAPAANATTIQIAGGKPVGGVKAIKAKKGDTVRIVVTSTDTTSEVHLHGYDIKKNLTAGGSVTYSFPASAEGIFEMELEDTATQIAKITIEP